MSKFSNKDTLPICDQNHVHEDVVDIMCRELPEEGDFIEAADLFSLLSDSTRLRMLWILCHSEACVCDIAEIIGMSSPAVSHHLRSLKQLGIITFRRQGKEVHYTLANTIEGITIHRLIDSIFDEEEFICKKNIH